MWEEGIPCWKNKNKSKRNGNRRGRIRGDGRSVLRGIRKTDHAGRRRRGESRRENVARRRVQAANFALRFSGHGRRRVKAAEESQAGQGTGDQDRKSVV